MSKTLKKNRSKYFQPSLDTTLFKESPKKFGGSLLKNSNPKVARPITTKKAMHIVLRSSVALYEWSFLHYKNKKKIEGVIKKQARTFNIKIYQLAINSNHIHLLIKLYTRDSYSKFIKSISGIIAKIVLGAERGLQKGIKFWDSRPFSRIVEWAKDFLIVAGYLKQNRKEAAGVIPYQARKYSYGG